MFSPRKSLSQSTDVYMKGGATQDFPSLEGYNDRVEGSIVGSQAYAMIALVARSGMPAQDLQTRGALEYRLDHVGLGDEVS